MSEPLFEPLSATVNQSLMELRAILENATVGILFTRNRRIVQANPRAAEMWGYRHAEMIGLPGVDLFPSEADYDALGERIIPLLQAGRSYKGQLQMRRRDGSLFWCSMSARAINPVRPMEATIWIMEDVTEERIVQEALERSTAELSGILDAAYMGIILVRDRRIVRCNRSYEIQMGFSPGELIGKSVNVLTPDPGEAEQMADEWLPDLAAHGKFDCEQALRRRDGSHFWARISGRALTDAEDAASSVWLVEDITDRHEAELALREVQAGLEQRVEERTADLAAANAKLQDEIFERKRTERRIWQMAHHDALTGLPNRALLRDRLDQALAQAARYRNQVAVMFIDLDRFKGINDTLGHAVGDSLLKEVAECLKSTVRAVDTVSRLGGDEFVVVLHEITGPDDAVLVAEKIIAALGQPVKVDAHDLRVTPSIGISVCPNDGSDVEQLMKNADTAMYHAKAAGRNTFQFFATRMNEEATRFFNLENRLRVAVERQELLLHYQPLVDIERRVVCGTEALVRWQDPEHGLIAPGEFIPVAEETGMIVEIGEWVLHQAIEQNSRWQAMGFPAVPVSVNLSPRQFRQKNLIDTIRDILAQTGQPAEMLELEITESTLMQDVEETLAKLDALAMMGVKLAIDDFGTGYSSLGYLKRFPVHKLKIDRSFVRDICDDREDAAIVTAIIGLARNLELDTLAEGVETDAQLAMLMSHGCRKFQGYYFSRPVSNDQPEALFRPAILGNQGSLL